MLIVSMLLLVGATSIPIRGKPVELTKANEKEIRSVLNDDHTLDRDALSKSNGLSQLALPLYGRILDNPDSDAHLVVRTLVVLIEIKADRSTFVDRAILKLADPRAKVRSYAVSLLGNIGSERDTAPIVALLADEEFTVGVAAAKALSIIGGPRELAALNIWLTVTKPENYSKEWQGRYESLRKNVTNSRDALKERLDKAKAQTPKP